MKPTKKTRTIEQEYWDCGCKTHHHRTERASQACIDRSSNRSSIKEQDLKKQAMRKRKITIAKNVISGMSYASAAAEFGVSGETARTNTYFILRAASRMDDGGKKLSYTYITNVRNNIDHWLNKIDKLAEFWGIK